MPATRTRLTPRGILVLTAFAAVAVTGISYLVVRTQEPDCTAAVGDREVGLSRDEAERAAQAVAGVVRRSGEADAARNAVKSQVQLEGADAEVVAAALSGRARAALTCTGGGNGDDESDRLDGAGLTGRAAVVRDDVAERFGDLPLGGFAPGGVTDGHMPGSAHYEGRALDIFFRPINAANKQDGWALAQYLVVNAERLSINTVIFDAKIWTARRSGSGWRDYDVDRDNRSAATIRILEHRDHVHVDVAD